MAWEGWIKRLLLCSVATSLALLPSPATRTQDKPHAISDPVRKQPVLYARSRYAWPFSKGPTYGDPSLADSSAPGVLHTDVGSFDLSRGDLGFPRELTASGPSLSDGARHFVLQVDPDSIADGRFLELHKVVERSGGAFLREVPNFAWIVRLSGRGPAMVAGGPGVLAVVPYHPALKLSPMIGLAPLPDPERAASQAYRLDALLFPGEDAAGVAQAIETIGGRVISVVSSDLIEVEIHRDRLAALAGLEPIDRVIEHLPVFPKGEETSQIVQTGGSPVGFTPYVDRGINGGGVWGTCSASTAVRCQSAYDCPGVETCSGGPPQVLMVLDSGVQLDAGDLSDTRTSAGVASPTNHRKVVFYDKIGGGDLLGCDAAGNGFTHGHAVAATALGNASSVPSRYGAGWTVPSGGPRALDGVAPAAKLVAYDAQTTVPYLPCDDPIRGTLSVGDIFTAPSTGSLPTAYLSYGARTFDFSWGTLANPVYGTNATKVDAFLSDSQFPEAMLFVSAGNEGSSTGSVSDPATAKNAVTVGATYTRSLTGDPDQDTRWPYSSQGPATAASGRIAPLLMAPGADFGIAGQNLGLDSEVSCRTTDNDQSNPVECSPVQGLDGTSYSAAAVAGSAMLVRDYFRQGYYPSGEAIVANQVLTMSGALTKAILVASADWVGTGNALGGNLTRGYRFNNEQGYGRVELDNVLPLKSWSKSPTLMKVADGGIIGGTLDIPDLTGILDLGANELETGTFDVCDASKELRIALAWIDTPGEMLNRNLDLEVHAPSGKIYRGNYFTDDNDRNGTTTGSEDCANSHLTGSNSAYDASPWSLETCANAVRDTKNPTEVVLLSPDARNDGTGAGLDADKQTETGQWQVTVKTGTVAAGVQRYAVVVAGGLCTSDSTGVSVSLDRSEYPCNGTLGIRVVDGSAPTPTATYVQSATKIALSGPGGSASPGTAPFIQSGSTYDSQTPIVGGQDGQTVAVIYTDFHGGKHTASAVLACKPKIDCTAVTLAQFGRDSNSQVIGGCETQRDPCATGFGNPDHYLDPGENLGISIGFQSIEAVPLTSVSVALRPRLAATPACSGPLAGSLLTILDSPKVLAEVPAGATVVVDFAAAVGPSVPPRTKLDLCLEITSPVSKGSTAAAVCPAVRTLNADEQSFCYSTDFPNGGVEVRDFNSDGTAQNPSPGSQYAIETRNWSSMLATCQNTGFQGPWNFESGKQGFTVGLNASSTLTLGTAVASWGEDKNFNGVLDYHCSLSPATVCPGAFPNLPCGRCQNNAAVICVASDATCGTCNADSSLGTCISDEDRDPLNGILNDNWSALGGCGWQTNGTTNQPATPGGVWHTGRIGILGASPCLVLGQGAGACQAYETIPGQSGAAREWELLRSPILSKVNQCNSSCGALPAPCAGVSDTTSEKVFKVEMLDWAWNMTADLKDILTRLTWELDNDVDTVSPIDLVGDSTVLGSVSGPFGALSGATGGPLFAAVSGGVSQNGTSGNNRVGRDACYFEQNASQFSSPIGLARPTDDADGAGDPYVTQNGPIRNWGMNQVHAFNPPWTLFEDTYGDGGEHFQLALGFDTREGTITTGTAQSDYGVAVDDVVLQWREYKTVPDATGCAGGQCAVVLLDTPRVFSLPSIVGVDVIDQTPYGCGSPKSDCNGNGVFTDTGLCGGIGPACADDVPCGVGVRCVGADDGDCNDNGVSDVVVKVTEIPGGAISVLPLDRVGASQLYRGSFTADSLGLGPKKIKAFPGSTITASYLDRDNGTCAACGYVYSPTLKAIKGQDSPIQGTADVVAPTCALRVAGFRVDDSVNGDGDGFPDTNETVSLYLTVANKTGRKATNVLLRASTSDPTVDCILAAESTLSTLASGATIEFPSPITFHVGSTVNRASVNDELSALFRIEITADGCDGTVQPQQVRLDLDLDATGPAAATTLYTEGFEGGFGKFQFMNLDFNVASNAASNGMRCQYTDPDNPLAGTTGDPFCYLGYAAGQAPVNDWHVHTTSSSDGGRSYLGNISLHWGRHTSGNVSVDTIPLSQMDAIRNRDTSSDLPPINGTLNLAARVCAALQGGLVKSCNTVSDCTSPASSCIAATPELSFKQQISMLDPRSEENPTGEVEDRGIVQILINGSTVWKTIYPYQNAYDSPVAVSTSHCMFDPTDDGNNEDSLFDGSSALGPSSTCGPQFAFASQGNTDSSAATDLNKIGRAEGPGLQGALGPGTWIETRFNLSEYRGQRILLRFLATTHKERDVSTYQAARGTQGSAADDGWYIDDVKVTQATGLTSTTITPDTKPNSGLPNACAAAPCTALSASLGASPPSATGAGHAVTLVASATADRCNGGTLEYQFWIDVNNNGLLGDAGDVLLRDWLEDPALEVAAASPTVYGVLVRCSSATAPPCGGATARVTVGIDAPYGEFLTITFATKQQLTWAGQGVSGPYELYRGLLSRLRSTGEYTQDPGEVPGAAQFCGLATSSAGDSAVPSAGQVYIYLVTSRAGGVESSLGYRRDGTTFTHRSNDYPCP